MTARLLAIGLATPPHGVGVAESIALARAMAPADAPPEPLETLHRRSGVRRRAAVIVDGGGAQRLYAPDPGGLGPTTGERLASYTEQAGALARRACAEALERAGVSPSRITHLVTASCTGFDAPGFDQSIIRGLGLARTTQRTHVGFMGCHGAINAMRVADAFARADSRSLALVCAVELCSLHYHYGARADRLIANALFADGAGACVVGVDGEVGSGGAGSGGAGSGGAGSGGAPSLHSFSSAIFPGTAHEMAWRPGDHGFEMTLAPSIPATLSRVVPEWLDATLDRAGLSRREVMGWAIHPGGPRILRALGEALGLNAAQLAPSVETLDAHGNMSSPTALFILRRLWEADVPRPWVCIAFGPGLAGEALVLR